MRSDLQASDQNGARGVAGKEDVHLPIVISIGSNLTGPFGPPLHSCRRAVEMLADLPVWQQVGQSDWYDTEPVPKSMQPNFVNGVAVFMARGAVDPVWLLAALQRLERDAGRSAREPGARGGAPDARPLDLDIVDIGGVVRDSPDPILPHPRAHLRRFVLEPLRDALPDWRHPVSGLSVGALLANLPDEGTRRLAAGSLAAWGGDRYIV